MIDKHSIPEAATADSIRRFMRVTFSWAASAAALATLHRLWTNTTGEFGGGWPGAWAALRDAPHALALFVPIAAFAGGIEVARLTEPRFRVRLAIGLLAALLALLLNGYIAPLVDTGLARIGLTGPDHWAGPSVPRTIGFWKREYASLLAARAAGEPILSWMLAAAGMQYSLPLAAAGLAAIVTELGVAVGTRTSELGARPLARLHHWLTAVVIAATVVFSYRASLTLAWEHAVPPQVAVSLVLVPPALLLIALAWSGAVASASRLERHDG